MFKHTERRGWEQRLLPREAIRQSRFRDFDDLHVKTRFNLPYIEEIADEYDFFVFGSDQVLNPYVGLPYNVFKLAPREKKISYAASIGIDEIPDDKKEAFREAVSGFNHISVREDKSVQLVKDLTGREALWVLDPTLLLTPEEWLTVAQKPTWFKEKYSRGYVLSFYLENFSMIDKSNLPPLENKAITDKFGLPVINLMDTENYDHYTVGPAEFVWLFANATLVLTNSFHGTAFSIMFKRPFIINGLRNNNDPRWQSLLGLFDFEDRMNNPDDPLKIDFSHRDEVLPLEKAKAFKYLSEALGVEPRDKE